MSKLKRIAHALQSKESMIGAYCGTTEAAVRFADNDPHILIDPSRYTKGQVRAAWGLAQLEQVVEFCRVNDCTQYAWGIMDQELDQDGSRIISMLGYRQSLLDQEELERALGEFRAYLAYQEFADRHLKATGKKMKYKPDGICAGDKVLCVNAEESLTLNEGVEYTVDSVAWNEQRFMNKNWPFLYKTVKLKETQHPYESSRFKKVTKE